jgi:MFS transporter, FHS family, L-fucose permease
MAIPAGIVMKKYGYKNGIIIGLLLFAAGAFLFIPSANTRIYGFFLGSLFIIASGLTFLETAANPYITVLGDSDGASQRLNLAQSFNGLAATIAPKIGGIFILSGVTINEATKSTMSAEQINILLDQEASTVKIPYLIIGIVVLLVAVMLYFSNLPEVEDNEHGIDLDAKNSSITKHSHLIWGVITQFFYVGAQVCVSSFFIRYLQQTSGFNEKDAANYLAIALLGFMIGRFVGTFLMKYIQAQQLLTIYAIINIVLLTLVVVYGGTFSLYALIGVEFFMSIMFPTIFALSVKSLGADTKLGSSLVIMSIVGGAIFPLIMGKISDFNGIQIAYSVPLICFFVIFYFGWKGYKVKNLV